MTRLSFIAVAALTLSIFVAPSMAAAKGISVLSGVTPLNAKQMLTYAGGYENDLMNQTKSIDNIFQHGEANATSNSTGNSGTFGNSGIISGLSATNNSGFTTLIANTGNQVSISQATNINIILH